MGRNNWNARKRKPAATKQSYNYDNKPGQSGKTRPKPLPLATLQVPQTSDAPLRRGSGRVLTRHGTPKNDTIEVDLGTSVDFV